MEIKFNETIRSLRRERGNTQEELAEHLKISVQAVSKWERGEGLPDISLLPAIAYFYDTTVDFLLGCDSAQAQADIEDFEKKARELGNKGKRQERLALCREYQRKYPNNESVLYRLVHDLFTVDCIENSDEIISISTRLMSSSSSEYHFGAVQLLAFTYSRLGNYELAVKYAASVPSNRDILRGVLKGKDLVDHCKWYLWRAADNIFENALRISRCPEASCTVSEQHKIFKSVCDIFNIIFSDGDLGVWEERLVRLFRNMAVCSIELGEHERAISELEEMCAHLAAYNSFSSIDHTSPLVSGLHYDAALQSRSCDEPINVSYLRELNENPKFLPLKNDARFVQIKERLASL